MVVVVVVFVSFVVKFVCCAEPSSKIAMDKTKKKKKNPNVINSTIICLYISFSVKIQLIYLLYLFIIIILYLT